MHFLEGEYFLVQNQKAFAYSWTEEHPKGTQTKLSTHLWATQLSPRKSVENQSIQLAEQREGSKQGN